MILRRKCKAAAQGIFPAALLLGAACLPGYAQTADEAPAVSPEASPDEANGAVFDAPGMPGVRMMAPIPDREISASPISEPAAAPPQDVAVPVPSQADAPLANVPMPVPAPVASPLADVPVPVPSPTASVQASSAAKVPLPVRAPPRPTVSGKSLATIRANTAQAFASANRGDWTKARSWAEETGDPNVNTLIQWRYLVDSGASAPFEEINAFLAAHPNWPRHDALVAAAERSMPVQLEPRRVIQWYGDRAPQTATGNMRLGEALMAAGGNERGTALIRKAWIEGDYSATDELQILQAHGDILGEPEHRARLDQLLARDDISDARRQMSRVDADARRIADARIRIKASPALASQVLASLPESLRTNRELLFDAARAFRRRGEDEEAWATLIQASKDPAPLVLADERWLERHVMTRDALKAGKYDLAYELVAPHGMTSGSNFADAEFLAGWIALRFLHKPELALGHFQKLADGVSLPISKARGYYWIARANEELGQTADAIAGYRKAAEYRETFYGQLALARVEDAPGLELSTRTPVVTAADRVAFEADDRIAAIRILAGVSDRDRMRLFAIRIANDPSDPKRLEMLAELMVTLGDQAMGVRVAKLASYNGVMLLSYLAPTMRVPSFPGKGGVEPETALVLGLTRQESEFDVRAVSSVGARGLMQLMPASARRAAKDHGLRYRLNDLTVKPEYNMQLGMSVIGDYLEQWGGSYILAIASYNAGAGNVTRWIETYGDPRDPTIDPIDWIELIPFGETRNYVERVLENVGVYRARLGSTRLGILADLHRPNLPRVIVLKDTAPEPPIPVLAPAQ